MTHESGYKMIDGIKCYNPDVAQSYDDYPSDGFDSTEKFEESNFWCRSRSRLLKNIISKYSKSNGRFLELGCGTGFFLRELSKHSDYNITGSDIYLTGLKHAKSKSPNTEFIQLDATTNSMPTEFDVIGAFDVIEHIENDEAVIANCRQSLVDNGYLIITVPQYQFLFGRLDELVSHKRRYNRADLCTKLIAHGFEIKFQTSFVFALFPFMLISRLIDRKPSANKEFSSDDFEKRVKLPALVNWIFDKIMHIDEFFIRMGISLPFGGSLLVVAQKK